MIDYIKPLAALTLVLALSLTLPACGDAPGDPAGTPDPEAGGHTHAHTGDAHDHDDHSHDEARSLGTIEIAGATFDVSIVGDVAPNSQIGVKIVQTAGPAPTGVRVWVGDRAATGARKVRAVASDHEFAGTTQTPPSLDVAALWIEIETAGGERTAASVAL